MKFFILILFSNLFSFCSLAQEEDSYSLGKYQFTPHITANAITRTPYNLSLQRTVANNINTHFMLSSLTVALLERVEVGTVPLFYFNSLHNFNYSLKYNFWRGKEFFWTLSTAHFDFDLDTSALDPIYQNQDIGFAITAYQILLNYFPQWTPFRLGFNYNVISTSLTGVDNLTFILSWEIQQEIGVDISYPIYKNFDLTTGFGTLRETGITAYEEVFFGFGQSIRWYRPNKFFSSPTLGLHYTPETGEFQYLFSSSIY